MKEEARKLVEKSMEIKRIDEAAKIFMTVEEMDELNEKLDKLLSISKN